jgi:ASC-1-like (ASCH) protein
MKDLIAPYKDGPIPEITVPKKWGYEKSVKRFRNLYREVRERGAEALIELATAHKALTERTKKRNRLNPWREKVFTDYCKEVGISPMTAYRWFKRYLPKYYLAEIKSREDKIATRLSNVIPVIPGKPSFPQRYDRMDNFKKKMDPEDLILSSTFPERIVGKTDHGIRKSVVFFFDANEDYELVVDCLADKDSITYKKRATRKHPPIMDAPKLVKLLKRAKKKGELST